MPRAAAGSPRRGCRPPSYRSAQSAIPRRCSPGGSGRPSQSARRRARGGGEKNTREIHVTRSHPQANITRVRRARACCDENDIVTAVEGAPTTTRACVSCETSPPENPFSRPFTSLHVACSPAEAKRGATSGRMVSRMDGVNHAPCTRPATRSGRVPRHSATFRTTRSAGTCCCMSSASVPVAPTRRDRWARGVPFGGVC